jgi:hypothetical protein
MRELVFVRSGTLRWRDAPEPSLTATTDALVRPFIAAHCDGDAFYLRHHLRPWLVAGAMLHAVDAAFRRKESHPFAAPFAYGHECSLGGVCTGIGFYLRHGTPLPLWKMYLNRTTLHVGVAHPRADLPALLALLQRGSFDPSIVTSLVADWEDAPSALLESSTKVVLRREPLRVSSGPGSS